MQGPRCFVSPFPQTPSYSRRHTSRVEAPDGVWVYWRCNGMDEVSRVRDLSAGGLFIAASDPRPVGTKAKLDFLVQEGQIRAEAIVRHMESGNGLGLKFTAVTEQDWPHLAALLGRLRSLSRSRGKP
jgi:PilZ domain-containing protein